jgi:hypothetical protein
MGVLVPAVNHSMLGISLASFACALGGFLMWRKVWRKD